MIKISKLADYSLIILMDLTDVPQGSCSAAMLAERTGISLPTVSKVLKMLNEAKLVKSIRGVNGGYQLTKKPEDLRLSEIIGAVDGIPALTECCRPNNHCIHDTHCQLRSPWQLINRVVVQALSQFNLADLKKSNIPGTAHG